MMSLSQAQFIAKLQSLDETQDSIVNTSKWLLTFYKEADTVASAWAEYLTKSSISNKRKLLVIYLANDVIQQARHKQVVNFDKSFEKVLPGALSKAYAKFPTELKEKVKRVVSIWRQRKILSEGALKEIDASLEKVMTSQGSDDIVNTSGAINKRLLNISSFYESIEKQRKSTGTLRLRFDKSLEALDPSSVVYAENFNVIHKIGSNVTDSLTKSINLRTNVIEELEKLLKEEKEFIIRERDLISEVESLISAKDPDSLKTTAESTDDALLPTYENEDDDDSDSDSNEENKENSSDSSNQERSSEDHVSKKQKLEESKSSSEESATGSPKKETAAIASSIQDLLSRLAD